MTGDAIATTGGVGNSLAVGHTGDTNSSSDIGATHQKPLPLVPPEVLAKDIAFFNLFDKTTDGTSTYLT